MVASRHLTENELLRKIDGATLADAWVELKHPLQRYVLHRLLSDGANHALLLELRGVF
jgi:hypothetical protein